MVFIVRMDTMPLGGFAQVRDPSKLDALGGPGIGAFCGFSTPENVLQRSTWRYEIFIYTAQASRVIFGLNALENIEHEVVQ